MSKVTGDPVSARFVCLNSFPKSGNTWVRSFLAHLLFGGDLDAIPDKHRSSILAGGRAMVGGTTYAIYKSHDRLLSNIAENGEIVHALAIHIIRHPLDVFVSWLNYQSLDPSLIERADLKTSNWGYYSPRKTVPEMAAAGEIGHYLSMFTLTGTLRSGFSGPGDWFSHSRHWYRRRRPPRVIHLRYENLIARGADELIGIGKFFGRGKPDVEDAFAKAQDSTRKDGRFFWSQTVNNYRNYLSEDQLRYFRETHADRLKEFGYEV